MPSNSITWHTAITHERESIHEQTLLLSYFEKLPQPPPTFGNSHSNQLATGPEAGPSLSKKTATHSKLRSWVAFV